VVVTNSDKEISMADIRWADYVWKEPRPVAPHELEQLEAKWGVELPEAYKRLVSAHQGRTPEPCVFKVGRGASVFSVLLTVTRDVAHASYSIQDAHSLIRAHVPGDVYPFGKTSGGEYLCFDYAGDLQRPKIVLVAVDMSVHAVTDSFQSLLDGLHDD
jgi:hypothetical protein